jgi:branched-chain amino acid transport system substrate-binding protein
MRASTGWKSTALVAVLAMVVAAACGDDDGGAASGNGSAEPSGLLEDGDPCDTSLDPYPIGMATVLESPILSLADNATALEASVEAFNARGGVGGHCMELTVCDSEGDPNRELDCARQLVEDGAVATLADTTGFNSQAVAEVFEAAGMPRIGNPSSNADLASPVTYAFGAGAAGTTIMMVPPLLREGITKIAAIHVDTPTFTSLTAALEPMLDASGAEMVATIPVPAGTTDFQQFILAADDAGAEGIILALGENEAVQVLQAAEQLGSELTYSSSLGSFGAADVAEFGDFASQMVFNAELPPATADQETWPILADAVADLEASGDAALEADQIKNSPLESWVAVYSFVTIIEQFGDPDDISREGVTAALDAAVDVDMFGLVPPWTPSASPAGPGPFAAVSQPWYYASSFDPDTGEFDVAEDRMDMLMELAGVTDYEQPVDEPGSAPQETTTTAAG